MDNKMFDTPEYKRYRKAYVTQCTVEHLVSLVTIDAFLAKILSYLNFSDSLIGVITSFTSVAFLFQIFSIFLVQTKISTKMPNTSVAFPYTLTPLKISIAGVIRVKAVATKRMIAQRI